MFVQKQKYICISNVSGGQIVDLHFSLMLCIVWNILNFMRFGCYFWTPWIWKTHIYDISYIYIFKKYICIDVHTSIFCFEEKQNIKTQVLHIVFFPKISETFSDVFVFPIFLLVRYLWFRTSWNKAGQKSEKTCWFAFFCPHLKINTFWNNFL